MTRVRVRDYGVLQRDSPLLRDIPSVGGPHRLHWRAAAAFELLAAAVRRDLGLELRAVSAWRPHRWQDRRDYEAYLLRNYPSLAEGRKFIGFDSPHETGLAVDIGVGGLWPTRNTIDQQRGRPLHRWLVQHAAAHGWTPYRPEPWHWEFAVDLAVHRAEAGEDPRLVCAPDEPDLLTDDDDLCEVDGVCELPDPDPIQS